MMMRIAPTVFQRFVATKESFLGRPKKKGSSVVSVCKLFRHGGGIAVAIRVRRSRR